MVSPWQANARALSRIPDVASQVATFVDMEGALARVQFGEGAPVAIPSVGFYPPIPGDAVQVERRNGRLVMLGPTVAKPAMGEVTEVDDINAVVTVVAGGKTYPGLKYRDGYEPVVGDPVEVNWVTLVVQGKVGTYTPPPPPIEVVPPTVVPFDRTFQAQDSGSFNGSRYYINDVWASNNVKGSWFYGSAPQDTLIDSWTVQHTYIYLPLVRELGAARIGVHPFNTKPSGWAGSASEVDLSPRSGWVEIPPIFGANLRDNGGGFSVTSGNGYNIWSGTQGDSFSGAVRVTGITT